MPGRSCRVSSATSVSELGKQIELDAWRADTELDRQVLDLIKDPLTHMVRNSADHGLESPAADRVAPASPSKGTIRLSAYHEGGHIIIASPTTAAA
jgi:two-component system chemotaxis sensor kinase CheA